MEDVLDKPIRSCFEFNITSDLIFKPNFSLEGLTIVVNIQ